MDDIRIEGAEIKTWTPRPAKFNNEGEEIEPPKLAITFLVEMDRVGRFITRIAWMFRHNKAVTLELSGVEQLPIFIDRDSLAGKEVKA